MENTAVKTNGGAIIAQMLLNQNGNLANNVIQVMISPTDAKVLLQRNTHNRHIRESAVHTLANDIKDGTFKLSPNPICIDTEGNLIDGQHRLAAVVKADQAAPFYVMFGVPHDTVVDRGITRTVGDSLYMRGLISQRMSNRNVIAAVGAYLRILFNVRGMRLTDDVLAKFLNEHEGEIESVMCMSAMGEQRGCHASCKKAGVQAGLLAALLKGVPATTIEAFCRAVNTGFYNGDSQSASVMLRNYMLNFYHHGGEKDIRVLCAYAEMSLYDFERGVPKDSKRGCYGVLRHKYFDNSIETKPTARGKRK